MLDVTVEKYSLALGIHAAVRIGQVVDESVRNVLRRHSGLWRLQDTCREFEQWRRIQRHILDKLHDQWIIAEAQLEEEERQKINKIDN